MEKLCYWIGHAEIVNGDCTRCHRYCYSGNRLSSTFWDSQAWNAVKFALLLALGISALLFLIIAITGIPTLISAKYACDAYAKMGVKVVWDFWAGCMANHPQFGWMPVDQYFKTLNVYKP